MTAAKKKFLLILWLTWFFQSQRWTQQSNNSALRRSSGNHGFKTITLSPCLQHSNDINWHFGVEHSRSIVKHGNCIIQQKTCWKRCLRLSSTPSLYWKPSMLLMADFPLSGCLYPTTTFPYLKQKLTSLTPSQQKTAKFFPNNMLCSSPAVQ